MLNTDAHLHAAEMRHQASLIDMDKAHEAGLAAGYILHDRLKKVMRWYAEDYADGWESVAGSRPNKTDVEETLMAIVNEVLEGWK